MEIFNNICSEPAQDLRDIMGFRHLSAEKEFMSMKSFRRFTYIILEMKRFFFGPIQTFKIFFDLLFMRSIYIYIGYRTSLLYIVNMYAVKLWSNILQWLIFTFLFNYIGIGTFFLVCN